MIGDHYHDKWKDRWTEPYTNGTVQIITTYKEPEYATREEIEELKKEVLEMKELLKKAIKYDRDNNEPDCQLEEKMATLKKVAGLVGVDLEEVFKS